jgi:2,3-diaminopropionate biosynthesis protein SbnA
MIVNSVHELIGKTPLIHLDSISDKKNGVNVYAKVEYFNPGYSVKDRSALQLIKQAELDGKLKPGGVIVESTSGNMGHSLAMLCAVYNYKFICVLDPKTPASNILLIRAFGGEIEMITEPDESGSFQLRRIEVAKAIANSLDNCINLDQYNNPSAITAHNETTGPEIDVDLNGKVDVLMGTVSTGSHLSGIARYFKSKSSPTTTVGVEPLGSVIFGGEYQPVLQNGTGLSFVPGNYLGQYIDVKMKVSDVNAFKYCRKLAKEDGLLLGGSSGAVAYAAHQHVKACTEPCNIVIICPDSGLKYLDTIYNDNWLDEKNLLQKVVSS